jgi:hypothetical protein
MLKREKNTPVACNGDDLMIQPTIIYGIGHGIKDFPANGVRIADCDDLTNNEPTVVYMRTMIDLYYSQFHK